MLLRLNVCNKVFSCRADNQECGHAELTELVAVKSVKRKVKVDSHNERKKQATESEGGQPLQMNAIENTIWLKSEHATNAAEVQGRAVPPSKLSLGVEIGEIGIEQYSVLHLLYHSRTWQSGKSLITVISVSL